MTEQTIIILPWQRLALILGKLTFFRVVLRRFILFSTHLLDIYGNSSESLSMVWATFCETGVLPALLLILLFSAAFVLGAVWLRFPKPLRI